MCWSRFTTCSSCRSRSTPARRSSASTTAICGRSRSIPTSAAQAVELIPDDVIAVAESGLKTRGDLRRLRSAGYDAFLIGERFMTADDPGAGARAIC